MGKLQEKIIIGLLALISLLSIFTVFKVYSLDKNTEDLALRTAYMESEISNISNNITSDITNALEKENSMINEFKYKIGDMKEKNLLLELNLLPKTYSPENKYYFSLLLKDGSSKLVEAKANSANYLVSTIEVPLQEDIELNYIEESKSGRKLESLEIIYGLEEEFLAPFNSTYSGHYHFYPDNTSFILDETFEIYYDFDISSYKEDKGIESAEIYLALDGDILESFSMKKGKSDKSEAYDYDISENSEVYGYTFKNYKGILKKDDELELYAVAKHSKGFKVKIPLGIISNVSNDEMEENMDSEVVEDSNPIIFED